jgi:hypothetical protein
MEDTRVEGAEPAQDAALEDIEESAPSRAVERTASAAAGLRASGLLALPLPV